jgi:outer membrane protein assembly factor BamB
LPAAVAVFVLAWSVARAETPPPAPTGAAASTDWFQWRGPERNGVSAETGWRTDWAADPPKTLWKANVGEGWSAVSIAAGRAYTMGNRSGQDTVYCLSADTGAEVWKHTYSCEGGNYPGPRMTPTVVGGLVYTLSRDGELLCLAADSGKVTWQASLHKQFGFKTPLYGYACSPLVLGDRLILDVGPTIALNKDTGQPLWKSGADKAAYSSPVAFNVDGTEMIAAFPEPGLKVVLAGNGREVGRIHWVTDFGANTATPIVSGNQLFISSAYTSGAGLFAVTAGGLRPVWVSKVMRNHANSCVLWNGSLYGFDGQVEQGPLSCVDFKSGARRWTMRAIGPGALMAADGKLILMDAKGNLIVAEASPAGYKELARLSVFSGTKCWTMPVLSGGRIFCRDHNGSVACLDVRKK